MKTIRILSLLLLTTLSLNVYAQNTFIACVDFMRVPENDLGKYVQMEKDIWKPMHQEWIKQGKLVGWYLWSIPYPGGTNAEYQYATVRVYTSFDAVENPMSDMTDVFKKVHPGKDFNKTAEQTLASRDLVKTYRLVRWQNFFAPNMSEPSKLITAVYFNIPMDKWQAYQEMETKYYHPTHKAEIAAGYRAGWEGWMLQQPMGMNQPFQFVAVDYYKDWSQYTKEKPESIYKNVLSEEDYKKREKIFNETVKLVNLEEWRLIDFVQKQPEVVEAKK